MGLKKEPAVPVEQLLTSLRVLVEDNGDIVKSGIDINDAFLLGFLVGRKHNLQAAYETVQKYVDVRRRKYVQFFSQVSPTGFIYLYDEPRFMAVLKHREQKTGCIVSLLRPPRDLSAIRQPFETILGLATLAADQFFYIDDAIKNGVIIVISGEGFGFSHMKEVTPARLKTAVDICYQAYPMKVKQIHVVNCSTVFNTVLAIFKPFLPRKLRKRIVVHNTLETFHAIFEPNIIPSWLGGNRREEADWEVYDYTFDMASLDNADYYEKLAKKLAEGI
ncbi:Alpha-tocopherol transfer protein-like [Orchesella cincta]|uniref:Alpha-tocopherol transfer protein-like n=1 Tax=Orchesella cincta TaxID=48709 RepID=A0A1D2MHK4_ORCCI|nr:Alpha-tocopherol transfer protein-like [Orchesella cincta]